MIIFVYGQDTFRSREKLRELIREFQKKRDTVGMNVVRLHGDEIDIDRLRQEILVQGFLSSKKMVITEGLIERGSVDLHTQAIAFLKKYIKEKDNENILLFWEAIEGVKKEKKRAEAKKLFDMLKKQKYTFAFPLLSDVAREQWIMNKVGECNGNIDRSAVKELSQRVGSDLWRLSNELHKLVALKEGRTITASDVEEQITSSFEANIFALTDAIAARNTQRALRLLNQERESGTNELYILTMVVRQFRITLQLHDALAHGTTDQSTLAKELKLHPFVVKKTLPLARQYTHAQLKKIYAQLLYIDEAMKTSTMNPEILLSMFVVSQ